jgi:hypothetical protein
VPKQYPRELRERAVRLVVEHRDQYETEYVASAPSSPEKEPSAPLVPRGGVDTGNQGVASGHRDRFRA